MRSIVREMLNSPVPVIVYVAPTGARAASAGAFITIAAHVAAMAPATNIGAAHPVAAGGGSMDKESMRKVENDAAAFIRSVARERGRNQDWAEKAVRSSVSATEQEALKLGIINLVAESLPSLLEKVDGRQVKTSRGAVTLHTRGATVQAIAVGWRDRFLALITDPNIAYILLMLGMLGLFFELANPGVILPGVIGGISLILAFFAFQSLPINWAGIPPHPLRDRAPDRRDQGREPRRPHDRRDHRDPARLDDAGEHAGAPPLRVAWTVIIPSWR